MTETIELLLEFDATGADAAELERTTTNLRRQLLELDVESVDRPTAGAAPPDARGIDLAAVGALLVALQQGTDVVSKIVTLVRSWVDREDGRTVKLTIAGDTIELTHASDEDQRRLVEAWLARHPSRARRKT